MAGGHTCHRWNASTRLSRRTTARAELMSSDGATMTFPGARVASRKIGADHSPSRRHGCMQQAWARPAVALSLCCHDCMARPIRSGFHLLCLVDGQCHAFATHNHSTIESVDFEDPVRVGFELPMRLVRSWQSAKSVPPGWRQWNAYSATSELPRPRPPGSPQRSMPLHNQFPGLLPNRAVLQPGSP